jgi:hypothetical protein
MPKSVFVSKPTVMTAVQEAAYRGICELLDDRGYTGRSLGSTDFSNSAPLRAILRIMNDCDGAIVLGFRQIEIEQGTAKPGTPSASHLENCFLSTPWNQIEASLAYARDLPVMLIREKGISGGVFDFGVTEYFVHEVDLAAETDWLHKPQFRQPFNEWCSGLGAARTKSCGG